MESYPGISLKFSVKGGERRKDRVRRKPVKLTPFKQESSPQKEESQFIRTEDNVFITIHKLKGHKYRHVYGYSYTYLKDVCIHLYLGWRENCFIFLSLTWHLLLSTLHCNLLPPPLAPSASLILFTPLPSRALYPRLGPQPMLLKNQWRK